MLYTADVWCAGLVAKGTGKRLNGRGARGFASKMARVQRMATLMIMGGMRSTASDILDAHVNVLPFQQTLRKICFKSTLRLATLPDSHPLARDIKTAYDYGAARNFNKPKRHPSPLHKLLYKFKINPTEMEKILPVRHYPKWKADVEVWIAGKKEEAAEEDELANEDLRVYADGSAIEGGVGAVAVLMRGEEVIDELRFHLGKDRDHTVSHTAVTLPLINTYN
ncbi:hypothetical protein F4604DRAFT_1569704 [Suillus subluteus]|nr:hypothetical protein F4604DRAFT_1569704 [Suillus subluteus]